MSRAALPPFQALIDEHRSELLGFLRAMTGPDEAEDCFQETFLAALRAYPRAEPGNLRAWLFTIARRKAIDTHRARARAPKPAGEPQAVGDGLIATRAPELDGEVWAHVAALPNKQRAAIALRFIADLRYREIGQALDSSEAAARRSVHDALRNLRGAVAGKESR